MRKKVSIAVEAELTSTRFAELGRPGGAFRSPDGEQVALCSEFPSLYWPGRALYEGHRLRHRLSLYTAHLAQRLAVFDAARFPINDVAFHRELPLLAVATGSYDGGWMFEGELILWNWRTGETVNVLSERREVTRVRFSDEGGLVVLLRPRDEEEHAPADPFDTFVGGALGDLRPYSALGLSAGDADPRLAAFAPVAPAALELLPGAFTPQDHARHWEALTAGVELELRHRVWDIAWHGEGKRRRVLAVHDRCHLEAWSLEGHRTLAVHGDGFGVQLLQARDASAAAPAPAAETFVHVFTRGNPFTHLPDLSTLHRFDGETLSQVMQVERPVLFSVDRFGNFLCRDTGDRRPGGQRDRSGGGRGDEVRGPDFQVRWRRDLGHYDCFNHHLRLDGGDALYFLRGTPPSSHEHKWLCAAQVTGEATVGETGGETGAAGDVREVFTWDSAERHLMGSTACLLPDGGLARAYRIYSPRPGSHACYLEAHDLSSGRRRWHHPVSALTTSMTVVPGKPWLIYALTDGKVGIMNLDTGLDLCESTLVLDGVPTMIMALAASGDEIAAGTVDGRVLLLRVHALGLV